MLPVLCLTERTSGVQVSKRLNYLVTRLFLARWYLELKCANCGEIPEKWQYIDQTEKQPLKGGRGEACAVMKCKVITNHRRHTSLTSLVTTALW